MKNTTLILMALVLVGCQTTPKPTPIQNRVITAHHQVMATDLMSIWTTCSNTKAVTVRTHAGTIEPLVRKTGRAVVESDVELFNLDYSYVALEQQGTAIVVLSILKHPTCSVSRQYRINLNKVTPEGSYGVVQ